MYKGYFCQRKNSQHIIHYHIIFSEIDILLLGYKKFNSESYIILKLRAHILLLPKLFHLLENFFFKSYFFWGGNQWSTKQNGHFEF